MNWIVSGKTTLLDVLAHRKRGSGVSGTILLNGTPIDSRFQLVSAYVTQEDVFVAQLSALETLQFYAALTLPARVSAKERDARVLGVLATLGLAHVKDTKVTVFPPISPS
jgi:ABC-type multidrug transport system ATPase subunit